MKPKLKTINLETFEQLDPDHVPQCRRVWRVLRVTDSIEFAPGDLLLKPKVDELCAARDWKVTVAKS